MAPVVKNPPAKQKTQVRSLGWEDPLEEGMATHSSILAWRIPWTEEPGRLQSIGSQRVDHDWSDLACTHAYLLLNWFYKARERSKEKNGETVNKTNKIAFKQCKQVWWIEVFNCGALSCRDLCSQLQERLQLLISVYKVLETRSRILSLLLK